MTDALILPKRSLSELVWALSERASFLSSSTSWDAPATVAIMREVADLLLESEAKITRLTQEREALCAEIEQRRSNILTHPNPVYRAAYVDALCMVLALLPRQEPT